MIVMLPFAILLSALAFAYIRYALANEPAGPPPPLTGPRRVVIDTPIWPTT